MLNFLSSKGFKFFISCGIFLSFCLTNPIISNASEHTSYSFVEQKTQTLIATDYVAPLRERGFYVPKFMWPVNHDHYNEGFGVWREDTHSYHNGLDIMPGYGTTIVSATDGVVVEAEYSGSFGNHVIIYDGGYYTVIYGHMIEGSIPSNIVPGAIVKMGDPIGQVGSTGHSNGPHLHYEIHDGDTPVDPWSVMNQYSIN
jgi:murein DD-endopeptidase MepM/ murein hydrolase activator NlpD